ncbi:MAG: AAA family ATPase [Candidatus Yanofskybacteria bacterium]|nr:AAA family ATPase [Candidatus Yanofskybacteria bacterium]
MPSEPHPNTAPEFKSVREEHRALRKVQKSMAEHGAVPEDLAAELESLKQRARDLVAQAGGFWELRKQRRETESLRPIVRSVSSGRAELRRRAFQIARASAQHGMTAWAERALAALDTDLRAMDEQIEKLRQDPESAVQLRMIELSGWRDQLQEGYAATQSRQEHLDRMQELIQAGKPIFLKGPTGTGKTELARRLVHELYGKDPEIVRGNPNVQEWTMIGQVGLRATEQGATETVFDPGPVIRAMTRGIPVVIDEFNQIDPQVRFVLKELYNRRPGDCVQVPNNGTHCIEDGFAIIVTANLGSRYEKARFPLDDAEERVFLDCTVDVGYLPPHELYDLCLASLIAVRGQAPVSAAEAADVLKRYCDAVSEIDRIYTDGTSAFDLEGKASRGVKQALEKTVIDPGLALRLVRDYAVAGSRAASLAEHLARRVTDLLVNLNNDNDRNLMAKVFSQFGIITVPIGDLAATAATRTVLSSAPLPASERGSIPLRDAALLDPYRRRAASLEADAESLGVSRVKPPDTIIPGGSPERASAAVTAFLRDTFQNAWSYTPKQLAIAEQNLKPEFVAPSVVDYAARKADVNAAQSGQYTLNPETVGIDWDSLTPEQIAERTEIVDLNADPVFAKLADKSLASVADFVTRTYGSARLPGLELERRLYALGNQAPAAFKEVGAYVFFFGSLIRNANGYWNVPYAYWGGAGWFRGGYWLENGWNADCRLVLVKR